MKDSWSYVTEGKGYPSNDTISPPNSFAKSKNSLLGWELKTTCSFSNDILGLGQQNIENQGFEQLGFPEMLGKQFSDDLIGSLPSRKVNIDGVPGGRITGSVLASPNAISGREDSISKLSNSVVDSNSRDSFIDLKLGRFADHGDAVVDPTFSKGAPILSSSESSTPPKKARSSGVNSQTAYCQVYGCNKDLSVCKDYHKRHKVCEVHSKTATVIVNGIEQRFCQQCSRFHLLAEFDDGKRSCRKRLAGHNERRRKPQVGSHSGKSGRLLQPYGDNRIPTLTSSPSFISPEMLSSEVMHSEKYGISGLWRPIKAEHGTDSRNHSTIPFTSGRLQSRSLFPSYNEKQFPFINENVSTFNTGTIFCENNSQYPSAFGAMSSGSRTLFHDNSLGSEDFNVFDTASTVLGLSGISDSSCALSLLSSQSQKSSSHSSGIPLACPLVFPSSHHCNMTQVSGKIGISSQASSSGVTNRFPSELNPAVGSHLSPVMISDHNDIVNFEMADGGIFQCSDFVKAKDHLSCENGATIDLLQLSSQLQRVEHQRQSLQLKQEKDTSCTLRITEGALEEETSCAECD